MEATQSSEGSVSLATARSGEMLDWSSSDKVALVVFAALPSLVVAGFRVQRLLDHPELEPYIDRYWLGWVAEVLRASLGIGLLFVPAWWWIRRRDPENPWFVGSTLAILVTLLAIGSYLLGHVSTPMFGGLVAIVCALLLFYEPRLGFRIAMYAIVTFFAPLPFVAAGLIPYGPVFREAPFVGPNASPEWVASTSLFAFVIALLPTVLLAAVVKRWRSRDAALLAMARLDMLTQVANRRYFFDRLVVELERAKRHRHKVALLLIDLDHFKQVNDQHGHLVGDAALVHVTQVIERDVLRRIDLVGRYGGEEFVILLPETDAAGATVVAERCRAAVESTPYPLPNGRSLHLTISVGVATPAHGFDADELLQRVDEALYVAKRGGRNRVEYLAPRSGEEVTTESLESAVSNMA